MSARSNPREGPSPAPLLSVRGLHVSYTGSHGDELTVLEDLDLEVAPGELVAIVGPSGTGKSTLARALTGELGRQARPHGGEARLRGEPLEMGSRGLSSPSILLLGQEPASMLHPQMTVERQLMEVLRARSRDRSRDNLRQAARDALGEVFDRDVERIARSVPLQLSGGLRQRAAIALVLAAAPAVLVADEPASALDATARDRLLSRLAALREETGIGVLLISHDEDLVTDADRVLELRDGRLHEDRSPEETPIRSRLEAAETRRPLLEAVALCREFSSQRGTPGGRHRALKNVDLRPCRRQPDRPHGAEWEWEVDLGALSGGTSEA